MTKASFDLDAGILVRKELRHLFRTYEPEITWFETKGWISSIFHVEGESELVKKLYERLGEWEKTRNA